MTSIDTRLSSVAQDGLFLVNIKRAIIKALKGALDDQEYPDKKIQGIKISMEYPMKEPDYPHVWVEFSFNKFQQAGIGHRFIKNEQLMEEWYFEGTVRFTVVALSSLERDTYSSQLMQLLAFSHMNPIAAKFDETLGEYPNIYMSMDRDILTPEGQSMIEGTPWSTDIHTYIDSYSVKIVGQMESTFTVTPEYLRKIRVEATGPDGLKMDEVFYKDGDTTVDLPDDNNPNPWI